MDKYEREGKVTILNSPEDIQRMMNLDEELETIRRDCINKENGTIQALSNMSPII